MAVAVAVAAFALRLVHLLAMRSNPLFERPIMDAAIHDGWARGLLDGTWPGAEPFFRAPLYPYLLGGLYALFDADRFWVQLVHVLISAAGAAFAALAAERLWGRRAGWCAGLLYALLWTSIYFSAELLLVTVPVTLNLAVLWVLVSGDERPAPRRLLIAGLLLGLSAIARPNVLIVVPVVLAFAVRGRPRSTWWRPAAILLLGVVLPIAPVTVSNIVRGGDAVLIASQGGVNFYIGNNAESDGRTAIVPGTRPTWQGGYEDAVAMAERDVGRSLEPAEVDRWFLKRGLAFWGDDPVGALRLYGHKLRMLVGAGERSNNKFIYAWRDWSPLLKLPLLAGWPLLLILGAVGAWRRPQVPGGRALVLGFAAAYVVSILLFFVNARFRLPVAAVLALPAGAGLDALWRSLRTRRLAVPVTALIVALVVGAASLADLIDFKERRTDANPFHAFTLGNAHADLGDDNLAIARWREALAVQARYPQTHFGMIRDPLYRGLSETLQRNGRVDEAVAVAERWLRSEGSGRDARLWYGNLLLETGALDGAAAQFEFLLRTDPADVDARLGEAWIMHHKGQSGAALRRFRTIAAGGGDAGTTSGAEFGAGLCLISLGRLGEAEASFQKVVATDPASWQGWGNLAGIYERTGRIDDARRAYTRLLALRPDDARARAWLSAN